MNDFGQKTKILVLEDHSESSDISKYLSIPYDLTCIKTVNELETLNEKKQLFDYGCLVAHLKSPEGLFLEWLHENGKAVEQIPLIVVSANEEEHLLTSCLDLGATDYLVKPVSPMLLKIKIFRSFKKMTPLPCNVEDLKLKVLLESLTYSEFKIFQLLKSRENFITRNELKEQIWKKIYVADKTIDVHLSNLRKKIQQSAFSIESKEYLGWRLVKAKS